LTITIRNEQFAALSRAPWESFLRSTAEGLKDERPELVASFEPAALHRHLAATVELAAEAEIRMQALVRDLIVIVLERGLDLGVPEERALVAATLARPEGTNLGRVQAVADLAGRER